MTGWASGYVSDIDYLPGFYRDQTPNHLDAVCLIQGVRTPRERGEPFRYCELGCGLGETSLLIAACHPEAEVVGFDFNPAHIDHARELARRAGLGNVRFEERSFGEIAEERAGQLPQFDYVTLHGIWTWVAREQQREIVAILNRHVRPGGVVSVTYNALPYWSHAMPFQRLASDLAATTHGRSDERINEALDVVMDIHAAGAQILRQDHLDHLAEKRRHDSAYLAHEYLNASWKPVYHADLARDLADAKLDYVGSAIPLENFPRTFLTDEQRDLVARLPPHLRETVSDHFNKRLFRRDVFVRGARSSVPRRRHLALTERPVALCLAPEDVRFNLQRPDNEIEFSSPFYPFAVEALARGPQTIGALRARFGEERSPEPDEILALGLETHQWMMVDEERAATNRARVRAVNRVMIETALDGRRRTVAIAAAGAENGFHLTVPAMMAYLCLLEEPDADPAAVAAFSSRFMAARSDHIKRNGEVLSEAAAADLLLGHVGDVLGKQAPAWRCLGAL